MTDDSDAADWAMALGGDGEAFGRVFDRSRARVERHARWLVGDPDDAADVVAVVFPEAWRKRDRVRFVDGSLLPWLLATAGNAARNQLRSARRYRALLNRLPAAPVVPDHADDDDGEALAALRGLNAREREVLVLSVPGLRSGHRSGVRAVGGSAEGSSARGRRCGGRRPDAARVEP